MVVRLKKVVRLKGHCSSQFSQSFLKLCRIERRNQGLFLSKDFHVRPFSKKCVGKFPKKARKVYLKSEVITEKIGGKIAFHHLVLLRHNLVWIDGFYQVKYFHSGRQISIYSQVRQWNTHPEKKIHLSSLRKAWGSWQAKNNYREKIIARNLRQVFL